MRAGASRSGPVAAAVAAALGLLALAPAPAGAAPRGGDILIADPGAFGSGGLILVHDGQESELSANSLPVNAASQGFVHPVAVAFTPQRQILVVDSQAFGGTGGVIAINPSTGQESEVSGNNLPVNALSKLFVSPQGLAVGPQGQLYVVDSKAFGGTGGVIGVDPQTGRETPVSANTLPINATSTLFGAPQGIAVNPAGQILVADPKATFDPTHGGVIAVDPTNGKESEFSGNNQPVNLSSQLFGAPFGIALGPVGQIFVSDPKASFDPSGGVIGIDPGSRLESEVSGNNLSDNLDRPAFSTPAGVTVATSAQVLIADSTAFGGNGGVISAGISAGREAVLASNKMPKNRQTPYFTHPQGIAVIPRGALPSVDFSFQRVKLNRRRGTATLFVRVPGPGKLVLRGQGQVRLKSLRARSRGIVRLPVIPVGLTKRTLRKQKRLRILVQVTYTPNGGLQFTQPKTLRLIHS